MKPDSNIFIGMVLALALTASTAWGEQRFAQLKSLALVSGETIEECQVGYWASGTLNEDRTNVIVFPTWFTGTAKDLHELGLIGPGKLADTDHYFVVSIDALGNGVSCSPSNSKHRPGRDFPRISTADMVTSQYRLLTEHLDIHHVRAVMGISMGGMQTFRWLVQYPNFMDKGVPLDGSPRLTAFDQLQWQLHEAVIRTLQDAGRNNDEIQQILGPLNLLTLYTPQKIAAEVRVEELDKYIDASSAGYDRIDWNDYVSQLQAMMDHNVIAEGSEAFGNALKADLLIVGVPSDHMVNPIPAKRLAESIIAAEYLEIISDCGHLGTSCEADIVVPKVAEFLGR